MLQPQHLMPQWREYNMSKLNIQQLDFSDISPTTRYVILNAAGSITDTTISPHKRDELPCDVSGLGGMILNSTIHNQSP